MGEHYATWVAWPSITSTLASDCFLLFLNDDAVVLAIPNRLFASEAERVSVATWAAERAAAGRRAPLDERA